MNLDATMSNATRQVNLGAHADASGVSFAVYSANAEQIELCLFDDRYGGETARLAFSQPVQDIWHLHVPGLRAGARYGLRAHGPHDPDRGHRFNSNKLLLDPYARALDGRFGDPALLCGYDAASGDDLTFDVRDSAPAMPRCVVTEDRFDWQGDRLPRTPWERTVIYEAHPRGLTMLMDKVPEAERGLFSGLASDPVIAHLTDLGITAIELLPVHAFLDDKFLTSRGRVNYLGVQYRRVLRAGAALSRPGRDRGLPPDGAPVSRCRASKCCWTWSTTTPPRATNWARRCRSGGWTMPAITRWIRITRASM